MHSDNSACSKTRFVQLSATFHGCLTAIRRSFKLTVTNNTSKLFKLTKCLCDRLFQLISYKTVIYGNHWKMVLFLKRKVLNK